MAKLFISKSGAQSALTLPLDAVTRTFAILGQRGTGKTTAAVVLVEQMAKAGGHAVVLDPVGVWYGITRDGEGKGVKGIVIGGEHGDVPLEETGGQLVAELVVGRHWPVVVIDMKLLRKGAQLRFMADFLEGLFHSNREPLHVVFEEADRPLPQQGRNFDVVAARVLGAGEDIVKLGRSRGLGATLVTQRPATLNKNVLEVCEILWLFRLMGPNDRKAAKSWVEANADEAALKRVMDSLAQLGLGESWFWSPAWIRVLRKIRVRNRQSFDSSATPEVGASVEEPGRRAPVDLDALRSAMAETIERAKENDPAELRKRIVSLERDLAAAQDEQVVDEVEVEVLVPDLEAVAELSETVASMQVVVDSFGEAIDEADGRVENAREVHGQAKLTLGGIREVLDRVGGMERTRVETAPGLPEGSTETRPRPKAAGRESSAPAPPRPAASSNGGDPLAKAPRALLDSLLGVYPRRLTKYELSTLSGYKPKSSTYRNALSALRTRGLLDEADGTFLPSAEAMKDYPAPERKSPAELREMWLGVLAAASRAMLQQLYEAYPEALSREQLAEATGYSITSSTFRNGLSGLRTNGLIRDAGSYVFAADSLFIG